MEPMDEAQREFATVVPFGHHAFMVLQAHLLAEQHLFSYISSRLSNPSLLEEVEGRYSPVGSGLGLILLAQALSLRDEVPPTCSDLLWPALKTLNELRNQLAHELRPDPVKVDKKMRKFVELASGSALSRHENLNQMFYAAAKMLVAYLAIDRNPMTMDDTR